MQRGLSITRAASVQIATARWLSSWIAEKAAVGLSALVSICGSATVGPAQPIPGPARRNKQNSLRTYIGLPSGFELSRVDRQTSDTLAGRGEDRISDCWRNNCARGFAEAAGRFSAFHDVRLDHRRFIDAHRSVVMEIALLDASGFQRDRAVKSGGQPGEGAAIHFGRDRVALDDETAIHCANQ